MDTVDYKEKFEKLIQRIDNLIVNGWIDEKAGKAILKDFTLESEDERIRKELISLIKETHVTDRYYDLNKMLAWLEKQGEQEPVEQKTTWSKDDVEMLNTAISFVEHSAFTSIGKGRNNVISWLKCLKDRMIWKPTEEQMEALGDAVKLYKSTHFDSHHYKIETLYNDLKKL